MPNYESHIDKKDEEKPYSRANAYQAKKEADFAHVLAHHNDAQDWGNVKDLEEGNDTRSRNMSESKMKTYAIRQKALEDFFKIKDEREKETQLILEKLIEKGQVEAIKLNEKYSDLLKIEKESIENVARFENEFLKEKKFLGWDADETF